MKILIIRHAVAQEKEDFKLQDDDLRPLTAAGKKEFLKLSQYYKKLYPNVDSFFSSPLLRATQTADILKKKFNKKYVILEELKPEHSPENLLKKLISNKKTFMTVIGHEPSLSQFIGYAITGKKQSIVELKKGGACLIEIGETSKIITLHSPKSLLKLKIN